MTTHAELDVGIVGGSIAGCAAAIAAQQAGRDVAVYERSAGDLAARGFGLTLSPQVHADLTAAGYLSRAAPIRRLHGRRWLTRDADGGVKELWHQRVDAITCDWGQLWRWLRNRLSGDVYRVAQPIRSVHDDGDQVTLACEEGSAVTCDLVVGADGYRSRVRDAVADGPLRHADYVAFRGVLALSALGDEPSTVALLADAGLSVLFEGGHAIVYIIPGDDGPQVNWALYARPRAGTAPPVFDHTAGDGLGAWARSVTRERLPERIAEIIDRTPDPATGVQPVVDRLAGRLACGGIVLTGDAAAVTRPHTGSGAVKALQDALALERTLRMHRSARKAAAAYDAERLHATNQLVELGRRIGRDQVEQTPLWSTMDSQSLAEDVAATWAGQRHYLHDGTRAGVWTTERSTA